MRVLQRTTRPGRRTARWLGIALAFAMTGSLAAHAEVLAHWTFDEITGQDANTLLDATGHTKATIADKDQVSADTSADVPFGKALSFSGKTGSYLNTPAIGGIYDHSFSIAVWFKIKANERNFILADWKGPNYSYAFGLDTEKDMKTPVVAAYMRNNVFKTDSKKKRSNQDIVKFLPRTMEPKKEPYFVTFNVWHHVAWVWNRVDDKHGSMTAYLDGNKLASMNQQHSPVDLMNSGQAAKIGLKQDTETTFHGSLDELWVFGDALTAEQVKNLMKDNNIDGATQIAAAVPAKPLEESVPAPAPQKEAAPTPAAPEPAPSNTNTAATPPAEPGPTAGTPAASPEQPAATPEQSAAASEQSAAAPTPPAATPPSAPARTEAPKPPAPTYTPPTPPVPAYVPPVASVPPAHYSPARLVGLALTATIALCLSGFLLWAVGERAKMRYGRS